jgi:hypothetical protein
MGKVSSDSSLKSGIASNPEMLRRDILTLLAINCRYEGSSTFHFTVGPHVIRYVLLVC